MKEPIGKIKADEREKAVAGRVARPAMADGAEAEKVPLAPPHGCGHEPQRGAPDRDVEVAIVDDARPLDDGDAERPVLRPAAKRVGDVNGLAPVVGDGDSGGGSHLSCASRKVPIGASPSG